MWKKCHYRSLRHDFWEPFSKHELHSGDWVQIAKRWHVFSFLFVFFRCSFFLLFSLGFRASGITCIWWHFESQSLVWSIVACFNFNFSAHPCRLQPMVLWPVPPSVIEMFGPAFAFLVPTHAESCWLCFDGSMRYVATRDQKRHWFLMRLFVSCCQTFGTAWPALSKQNQFW